jgi:hypothetical protein
MNFAKVMKEIENRKRKEVNKNKNKTRPQGTPSAQYGEAARSPARNRTGTLPIHSPR